MIELYSHGPGANYDKLSFDQETGQFYLDNYRCLREGDEEHMLSRAIIPAERAFALLADAPEKLAMLQWLEPSDHALFTWNGESCYDTSIPAPCRALIHASREGAIPVIVRESPMPGAPGKPFHDAWPIAWKQLRELAREHGHPELADIDASNWRVKA